MIGRPAPGIRRHPSEPKSWIERPRTIHKRVPPRAHQVRLPHHSVPWCVEEISVISQVRRAVRVRRIALIRIAGVTNVIVALLFVPGIERFLLDIFDEGVAAATAEIKISGLVLLDRECA